MTSSTPPSSPTSPPQSTLPSTPGHGNDVRLKIIKWLLFNIFFALMPLIYRYLKLCIFNSCVNPLEPLYKQGELLLLSTAVLAESMGELANPKPKPHYKYLSVIMMGLSFLVISLNTNMFLDINAFSNAGVVSVWSCSIYFTSIIFGLCSKVMGQD